jgi:hypothetical protein
MQVGFLWCNVHSFLMRFAGTRTVLLKKTVCQPGMEWLSQTDFLNKCSDVHFDASKRNILICDHLKSYIINN